MRKHHNKLYYSKYRYKTIFNMPWAGMLYPTTDQTLIDIITGKKNIERYLNVQWYKVSPIVIKLAKFILDKRSIMKFRLQQNYAIFYSDKSLAHELIETFWDTWHGSETVNPNFEQPEKNTVGCYKLPHGKFQYQVHFKKDVHKYLTTSEREGLWKFIDRNEENCLVTSDHVIRFLMCKDQYCYNGYFYAKEEKMLTPIYMIAQNGIEKVIKYIKIENDSNKKTTRT